MLLVKTEYSYVNQFLSISLQLIGRDLSEVVVAFNSIKSHHIRAFVN